MDRVRQTFLPEDDVFQVKGILDDAGCGHSDTKHVLLRGHKGRHGDPVNVTQVTVALENKALIRFRERRGSPPQGSHPDSEQPPPRFMGSIHDSESRRSYSCFRESMDQKLS